MIRPLKYFHVNIDHTNFWVYSNIILRERFEEKILVDKDDQIIQSFRWKELPKNALEVEKYGALADDSEKLKQYIYNIAH